MTGRAYVGDAEADAPPQERTTASDPESALERDLRDLWPERDRRHVVLRLTRVPSAHDRGRLAELGVTVLQRVGPGEYAATLRRGSERPGVDQLVEVVGLRAFEPAEKLHPSLRSAPPDTGGEPPEVVYVRLWPDEPDALNDPRRLGVDAAAVLSRAYTVETLVVRSTRSRVQALARDDRVAWIEPALPPLGPHAFRAAPANDQGRASTQSEELHGAPYFLDGSGVRVLLFDGGRPRIMHVDFGGRVHAGEPLALGEHSTHVAGIIGGDGTASGGQYAGHAPGVLIEAYGLDFGTPTGLFFYTDPGDLEADYAAAILDHDVVIANNSLGLNVDINNLPCSLQGDYGVTSALVDGIVRGSLGAPFRVVWSAGNERAQTFFDQDGNVIFLRAHCPAAQKGYGTIPPPSGAKNPLCVGALNSSDESMTVFTSWGPTDDGRLKPDLVGPGCDVGGGAITSTYTGSNTDYGTLCGTSMSAPAATGCAALLMQALRPWLGRELPLNSTLKALLIQNAADKEAPGPDYRTGYGALRIKDTVDALGDGRFLEDRLEHPEERRAWVVEVGPADAELKVTLAWDDAPQTPSTFGALVNDLELEVRDPAGTRHFPWTLDPSRPDELAARTRTDHVNNVEQVRVGEPLPGPWRVSVHAADTPELPQSFSLASSHPLAAGPGVELRLVDALPGLVRPGAPVHLRVDAQAVGGEVLLEPVTVVHRRRPDARPGKTVLRRDASGTFSGSIPGPACGAPLELWIEARGAQSGLWTLPPAAPERTFTAVASHVETLFEDDFEADRGWTVTSGPGLQSGAWERAVPTLQTLTAPTRDQDGSGRCFLTDNGAFADVDGAVTRLESPPIGTAGKDVRVSFAVWCASDGGDEDRLRVELTTDAGATWTEVASFQNTGGWRVHTLELDEHVEPGARVAVRFTVADDPDDSFTEAAIDRFRVERVVCSSD